jgi:hypothetical protein
MDNDSILYLKYLHGCELKGWTALSEEEFFTQYPRYLRCRTVLREYQRQQAAPWFRRGLGSIQEWWQVRKMVSGYQDWKRLKRLEEAVTASRTSSHCGGLNWNDEEGGSGIAVYPMPKPPTLWGAAAKLLPYLDPEPAFRDP